MAQVMKWLCVSLLVSLSSAFRYDGYHLVQLGPIKDEAQLHVILKLGKYEGSRQVIFMDDSVVSKSKGMSVILHPALVAMVRKTLSIYGVNMKILNTDVQIDMDRNRIKNEIARHTARRNSRAPPSYYMPYPELVQYITDMANASPNATLVNFGTSGEGREMYYIAINQERSDLPSVFVDGGTHAREWISPTTAQWLLYMLLESSDAEAIRLRNSYRWYVAPCVNPDGYSYTHDSDRLWRKNRNDSYHVSCVGVDLNRNYDFEWSNGGSSASPCSNNFHGAAPFSEVETRNLRSAILTANSDGRMILYISLHSFSQYWLVPWNGRNTKPVDYDQLMEAGRQAVDAIFNTHGATFDLGTSPDIMYLFTGGTSDWVKENAGVQFSYTPELRPEDGNPAGFEPGVEEIQPSGEEIFAGIAALLRHIDPPQ